MLPGGPQHEERDEDEVEGDDRAPEMDLAQGLVHHAPEHLREPEGDAAKVPMIAIGKNV